MRIETFIRFSGGLLAYATLAVVLYGIWRGTQQQTGRTSGKMAQVLRAPWFYLLSSLVYFGICYLGWKPLPLNISPQLQIGKLITGSLLYFPGMGYALWGRLALGKNYFVSTGFGAQLFSQHQLVTWGPYAFVRHPMYAGLLLASMGSFLIYTTWTTLFFVSCAPFLILRARREETILAAEFGEQWQDYCHRVPAFLPRVSKPAIRDSSLRSE